MSARVNLLPREVEERNRARRERVALGIGALVLVGLLALAYVWKLGQVGDARAELEDAEAQVAELEAELSTLQEFEDLERRTVQAEALLEAALGDEVTMAGALQDLAAVVPTDTELDNVTITIGEPAIQLGAQRVPIGSLTSTGATVGDHAPGLERLLIQLGKVAAFNNVFFTQATADEATGAVSFTIEVDLGQELFTRRYTDGLPEELR